MPTQVNFSEGLNAVAAPHALVEGAVQAATNVDFGLEAGAAICRRGCGRIGVVGASTPVRYITRIYNNANPDAGQWYAAGQNGVVYRGTWSSGTVAFSSIGSSTGSTGRVAVGQYYNEAFIAREELDLVDTGSTTYAWFLPQPAAPTLNGTIPLVVNTAYNAAYTAAEGTVTASSTTSSIVYTTATSGTDTRITLSGTITSTNLEFPSSTAIVYDTTTYTSSNRVGIYGIHYLPVQFASPGLLESVAIDYSYGDTTFTNYYHYATDAATFFGGRSGVLFGRDSGDVQGRAGRQTFGGLDVVTSRFTIWAIPKTDFVFVGATQAANPWENIQAVQVTFVFTEPTAVIVAQNTIKGDELHSLTDFRGGYRYYVTYQRKDADGNILAESSPSPASAPLVGQHMWPSWVLATLANVPSGVTHLGVYRQGGLLDDIYKAFDEPIDASTYQTSKFFERPDLVLQQENIKLGNPSWTGSTWPKDFVSISEPFYNRLFVGYENKIAWSMPNSPTTFPNLSNSDVSHYNDPVQQLLVWDRLIIVNRDSVYEMDGNTFEVGPKGEPPDYVLKRSGSKRGSKAPLTCIKTPYGIPLLDYDGISMYVPSHGVDTPLNWVNDVVGDCWKGTGTGDPAGVKGNRVPAVNLSYLQDSCAAFANEKLYLAMPTGTATTPNTVFALDFNRKKVDVFQYPFNIISMYWDFVANRLVAGTTDGSLMLLENAKGDHTSADVATSITWSVKTKAWSAPTEMVIENLSLEVAAGDGKVVATANIDNGTAVTLGTFTNSTKQWFNVALNGTIGNNVVFGFNGTQSGSHQQGIYGMNWEVLQQPPRVTYWRTEETDAGINGEKQWDAHFSEVDIIGTGTVTCVTFIDTVAVMTATMVGPTNGKRMFTKAYPMDTYGDIAYSTYTCASPVQFKFFADHHAARPEPPRVKNFVTDREFKQNETWWQGHMCSVNCLGSTVLATVFVDEVAIQTNTLTGNGMLSYSFALPDETYGDVIYVKYVSNAGLLKHYKTWYDFKEEPDRLINVVTERDINESEQWFQSVNGVVNCFGTTVLATVYIDEVALATYTLTGSGQLAYRFALPSETYGNVAHVHYRSQGGVLKHYQTWFDKKEEPSRLLFYETPTTALESENYLKTWLPEVNPQGGSVVGTLWVDGTAVTTATLVGSLRKTYELPIPTITTGKTVKATYTSSTVFKHYETKFEQTPKPFGKTSWFIEYRKAGGATALDLARFYSLDVEGQGTYTLTNTWEIDGSVFATSTHTGTNREWLDSLPLPPGGRGYLFQQKVSSSQNIKVWKANLDIERVGIKGLSRTTIVGRPNE